MSLIDHTEAPIRILTRLPSGTPRAMPETMLYDDCPELNESIRIIETLFSPSSAEILTGWCRSRPAAARTLSDLGRLRKIARSSGRPVREKLRSAPDRALEILSINEWRLDGITFALGMRALDPARASHLVAALLCLRIASLGRKSAPSLVLHLDRLLKCGYLRLTTDLNLELEITSGNELLLLIEASVNQALELTWHEASGSREELAFLQGSMTLARNALRILETRVRYGNQGSFTADRFVWT